jgi:1,4-alpha-glucan branching enzyme
MTNAKSQRKSKTNSKQVIKRRKVTFSFEAVAAKEVFLMGDFNNWDPKKHPMKNEGHGTWNKTLELNPGKYEYKFFVDGEWKKDPLNDRTCPNCYGTQNSVLNLE